uniref:Prostaglandin D2 receptor n=1 Tax=Meleagris gallopavo TaxID=9103 RepID=A0A803YNS6_MELGA
QTCWGDHLILLYFSQVRAYMGAFAADFNEDADLSALRFLSVNSIVDPWVFIIFRTSVFRLFVRRLCRRLGSRRATLKSAGRGGMGSSVPRDGVGQAPRSSSSPERSAGGAGGARSEPSASGTQG